LEAAIALGVDLVDTADSYGSSDCEKLLGSILKEMGYPMLVSSKAGYRFCDLPGPLGLFNQVGKKILNKFRQRQCFTPKYIRECLEGTLRRLRTGRLDFFFLHDPTESALMDDKLTETLLRVRQAGDVRFLGIACTPRELLIAFGRQQSGIRCVRLSSKGKGNFGPSWVRCLRVKEKCSEDFYRKQINQYYQNVAAKESVEIQKI